MARLVRDRNSSQREDSEVQLPESARPARGAPASSGCFQPKGLRSQTPPSFRRSPPPMQALTEEQAARMRAKLRDVRPPCRIPPSLGPHPTLAPCRLSQSLPCHVSGAQRLRVAAARRRPNRAPVCRRLPSGRGLRDGAKVSCRGAGRGLTATPTAANAGGHRTVCDVRCAVLAHALTTTMIDNRHTLILSDYSRLGGTGTPPIPHPCMHCAHISTDRSHLGTTTRTFFFSIWKPSDGAAEAAGGPLRKQRLCPQRRHASGSPGELQLQAGGELGEAAHLVRAQRR